MTAIVARFEQRCAADCGKAIVPGDAVVYVDDELVHEDCEELALLPAYQRAPERSDTLERLFGRPLAAVCEKCFIEKPCPCQDGL